MDLNVIITMYLLLLPLLVKEYFCLTSSIVFTEGLKSPQNPWNSNTLEWTTPVEHVFMETGLVNCQLFTDGLMTILNQVQMWISFLKLLPLADGEEEH
jgi:hypothetical protein